MGCLSLVLLEMRADGLAVGGAAVGFRTNAVFFSDHQHVGRARKMLRAHKC